MTDVTREKIKEDQPKLDAGAPMGAPNSKELLPLAVSVRLDETAPAPAAEQSHQHPASPAKPLSLLSQPLDELNQPAAVDLRDIPHRWFQVLSMHMAGHPYYVIADAVGLTETSIGRILKDPRITALRLQYLEVYEMEFLQLYPKFTQTLTDLMSSAEEKSMAAGAALFTKHMAMLQRNNQSQQKSREPSGTINLSAEEIVFNILNQNTSQASNER